jgi:hypothetical protein
MCTSAEYSTIQTGILHRGYNTLLSYEELANAIEDAWDEAGLHEHSVTESINPATLERTFRAEIFPDHGEPLTEHNVPPWVELSFVWGPEHQHASTNNTPSSLELLWSYTITLASHDKRSDSELLKTFMTIVNQTIRKLFQQMPDQDMLAIEIRRGYRSGESRDVQHLVIYASGGSDIGESFVAATPDLIQRIIREEMLVVANLLRALAESFSPGSVGGYRTVDSA